MTAAILNFWTGLIAGGIFGASGGAFLAALALTSSRRPRR
jgi:hypothetical protein